MSQPPKSPRSPRQVVWWLAYQSTMIWFIELNHKKYRHWATVTRGAPGLLDRESIAGVVYMGSPL